MSYSNIRKLDFSDLKRKPMHIVLATELKEAIASGQLQPGDRLPSFKELRERWGVGTDTLEQMYRLLEDEGIISRRHRRGVFVSESRNTRKTGTIGFINSFHLQRHPYYVHLLHGMQREADAADIEILLLSQKATVGWEKVDGILYQATQNSEVVAPPGMPHVSLIYARMNTDSVTADDYLGLAQAMEHLWGLGHRRIAFLTLETLPYAMSHQRIAAYQDAFSSRGLQPEQEWTRTLHEPAKTNRTWEQTGYDDMKQWLKEDWATLGCTAILAHNDETAIGVIAALREAGLQVPQDVSVVGFDGTEIAHFHRPRLTTVKIPLEEIGARGFEMLMQSVNRPLTEIRESRVPSRLVLETRLQIGESTSSAPII